MSDRDKVKALEEFIDRQYTLIDALDRRRARDLATNLALSGVVHRARQRVRRAEARAAAAEAALARPALLELVKDMPTSAEAKVVTAALIPLVEAVETVLSMPRSLSPTSRNVLESGMRDANAAARAWQRQFTNQE